MSRPLYKGKAPYKPLSNKAIHRILHTSPQPLVQSDELPSVSYPAQASDQQDAVLIFSAPANQNIIYRHYDYDSLSPSDCLKAFLSFLRQVKPRYEDNFHLVGEADYKTQDILHEIEMSRDKDIRNGYDAYKLLREVRRDRRVCKNENELLRPVITFLEKNPTLIDDLERLQSHCQQLKETIDDRYYTMRTDVLSDVAKEDDAD